jgi:Flp pilus assembly protein TadG
LLVGNQPGVMTTRGWLVDRGPEQGASAVEFALLLPVLVLLLFGILQFGQVFARAQGMEAAAREGARTASIGRTVTFADVQAAARGTNPPFINSADIQVAVDGGTGGGWCSDTDDFVTVEVTVDPASYALTIPLFGDLTFDYSSTGTFRCEAPHE